MESFGGRRRYPSVAVTPRSGTDAVPCPNYIFGETLSFALPAVGRLRSKPDVGEANVEMRAV